MKLKSLNRYISFFILLFSFLPIYAEEEIDIWNKDKKKNLEVINKEKNNSDTTVKTSTIDLSNQKINDDFKIQGEVLEKVENPKVFGIYEPADNDFGLTMWSETKAEDIRLSIARIKKIELSKLHENLENLKF